VVEWFAQRADLILLLFDAHKLDISDEFKSVIESLKVCFAARMVIVRRVRACWVSPTQNQGATARLSPRV